jgi:DNA-binding CsgD family transcriptional regulator
MNRVLIGDDRLLLDASRRLLQCNTFETLAQASMESLQRLLGADSSCMALAYDSDDERHLYRAQGCGVLTKDMMRLYQRSYSRTDPVLADILSHEWDGRERIVVLEQIVDMKRFRATEIYEEFLRPLDIHHVMGVAVPLEDGARALLGVHRQQHHPRGFDVRHVTAVHDLLPALAASFNAMLARERLEDRETAIEALASGDTRAGAIVLDERARVLYADPRAEAELRELRARDADPGRARQILPRGLRQLVLNAIANCDAEDSATELAVDESGGGHALRLTIKPAARSAATARYLLTIASDRSAATADPRLLRLTARERQIADRVARGLRNPEIAGELSLSVRTIENHLRSIYAKLQVRNRASLAGLLCALGAQSEGRITAASSGDACSRSTRLERRVRTAA